MFSFTHRAFGLSLLCAAAAGAQTAEPTVREILKTTDTSFVSGVAEPASGRFIAYADEQGITIWNRASGKTTRVPGRIGPQFGNSLSLSASGGTLVFARPAEDGQLPYIWRLDLDTLTGAPKGQARRVSVSPSNNASISPDGKWVAMAAITGNKAVPTAAGMRLVVIPSDGGDERILDSAGITSPRWTPDGRAIVYQRSNAVTRIAATGGRRDSLAAGRGVIGVSPDGKYIAFVPPWGGGSHPIARIIDQSGHLHGSFVHSDENGRIYEWSRTQPGHLTAYLAQYPAQFRRLDPRSGALTAYPLADEYASTVHFSPNGRTLGFITHVGNRDQLVLFDTVTHQRRLIQTAEQPGECSNPCDDWRWSPDGKRIGFVSTDATTGQYHLFVVDVASEKTRHIANLGRAFTFRWRSDSRGIQYIYAGPVQPREALTFDIRQSDLAGHENLVRRLEFSNPPGYPILENLHLISDSLAFLGAMGAPNRADSIMIVPLSNAPIRTIYHGKTSRTGNLTVKLAPDGRWLALTVPGIKTGDSWVIMSLDGKTMRRLGNEMDAFCGGGISKWSEDGRRILAWGAKSCSDWVEEPYIIDVDAGTVTAVPMAKSLAREDWWLMPNGRDLLVQETKPMIGHIVSLDLAPVMTSRVSEK